MAINLTLIIDVVYATARVLLEFGAALALAGFVASLLVIVLTWRPAGQRRRAALAYRSELQSRIESLETAPAGLQRAIERKAV
ncbi:hypothetical protein CKALI_09580 [Corynebacterium kalinowskii]|uniref:Uncharacterized protein n=1 Tax=Corynebacterium kalinowskii TaxID=2675216 RepID=A0A6B8VSA1_9CORY|nr:hypothetical protein [Corynebacterium kalinowskii]QGU02771.1 hypothetical protein CKALI_09580 [Corynebacterium kalinowskii]